MDYILIDTMIGSIIQFLLISLIVLILLNIGTYVLIKINKIVFIILLAIYSVAIILIMEYYVLLLNNFIYFNFDILIVVFSLIILIFSSIKIIISKNSLNSVKKNITINCYRILESIELFLFIAYEIFLIYYIIINRQVLNYLSFEIVLLSIFGGLTLIIILFAIIRYATIKHTIIKHYNYYDLRQNQVPKFDFLSDFRIVSTIYFVLVGTVLINIDSIESIQMEAFSFSFPFELIIVLLLVFSIGFYLTKKGKII